MKNSAPKKSSVIQTNLYLLDFTSEIELVETIFWTHDFKLKSCSQKEQINRRRDPENSETHQVVHH